MTDLILRTPPTDLDQDHRLRAMIAAPIGEWSKGFEERFSVKITQGYGMTEINMVSYADLLEPAVPEYAGRVLEDLFELRIVDPDTDEFRAAGEVGEIVVRPKIPGIVTQGYFGMPERTVEAWRNLWFHTGDAGVLKADGRLFFKDRIRDRLRRRGENISAYEVEHVLNKHPHIVASAVVGVRVRDAGGEEEVKAFLVPAPGTPCPTCAPERSGGAPMPPGAPGP
jgi:crotonobetaine/carnitine-CoA ligase